MSENYLTSITPDIRKDHERHKKAFAAFYRDFAKASGTTTSRAHMDTPNVLFSETQRHQLDAVWASLIPY